MKKRTLLIGAALAAVSFFAVKNHYQSDKLWFTLENIRYDKEQRMIVGECTEGTYLGEMVVYLPAHVSDKKLTDGITVKVYGGPGMTMSLPPQLMNCQKIKIINENAQE